MPQTRGRAIISKETPPSNVSALQDTCNSISEGLGLGFVFNLRVIKCIISSSISRIILFKCIQGSIGIENKLQLGKISLKLLL